MKHQAMSTKHGSEEMNTSQHCTEKKKKKASKKTAKPLVWNKWKKDGCQ